LPIPDSLPDDGSDAVEPVDAEGSDGADVPVDGIEGTPLLGAGDGVEGTGDGVPPVLGMGLPDGLLVGLGTDGAPPPAEFVLHPAATRIVPMAMATSDDRITRASNRGVFIEMYLWSRP
jgi:hypothetical protein